MGPGAGLNAVKREESLSADGNITPSVQPGAISTEQSLVSTFHTASSTSSLRNITLWLSYSVYRRNGMRQLGEEIQCVLSGHPAN
jgi:hypothetical protein